MRVHDDVTLNWNAHAPANDLTPTYRPGGFAIVDVGNTLTAGCVTAFVAALLVEVKHVEPLAHTTPETNGDVLT